MTSHASHREAEGRPGGAPRPADDDLTMGRDYIARNRSAWNEWAATFATGREQEWASEVLVWGMWGVPEAKLNVLPQDVDGLDTVELGCGSGYVSAWLARRGARAVGVDLSSKQLATAQRLQREHRVEFALCEGNAEELPFADGSFDLAISDYGASVWADPYLWIPEAARILRPGGRLTFLVNGTIAILASPDAATRYADESLHRAYFGMHRFEWPNAPSVEFHIGYGDMIRLLRSNHLQIEDLIEIQPSEDAESRIGDRAMVSLGWSRRWPCEQIWKAVKDR